MCILWKPLDISHKHKSKKMKTVDMSKHLPGAFPDVIIEVFSSTSSKSSSTQFMVHREILEEHPELYALVPSSPGGARGGKAAKAVVSNVKPAVFHIVLRFIYGVEVPKEHLMKHAESLLHAAEMFSLGDIKTEVEKAYSKHISIDNVVGCLCFADKNDLPLLKQEAEQFVADGRKESIRKLSFEKLPSKLVQDLLLATKRTTKRRAMKRAVKKMRKELSKGIYPDVMSSDLPPDLNWFYRTFVSSLVKNY